jgi:hypothetical protein
MKRKVLGTVLAVVLAGSGCEVSGQQCSDGKWINSSGQNACEKRRGVPPSYGPDGKRVTQ